MTTRRIPWPRTLGPDTPHDRARAIARAYRDLAAHHAPSSPDLAAGLAQLDATARLVGEDAWLLPSPITGSVRMTREEVAHRAGVTPDAVSQWSSVGLTRVDTARRSPAEHRVLPRRDGGYHRQEVDDWLSWRDLTRPHRPRRTPIRVPSPHASATAAAAVADTSNTPARVPSCPTTTTPPCGAGSLPGSAPAVINPSTPPSNQE